MYFIVFGAKIGNLQQTYNNRTTIDVADCASHEKSHILASKTFPQLIISYYAKQIGLRVILNDEKLIGMPIEALVPEERFAIEAFENNEKYERVKKHLYLILITY